LLTLRVFEIERTSQSGDGQVFVAREHDPRLLVGALQNGDGHSLASYEDFIAAAILR
jgi:hypothetical protein